MIRGLLPGLCLLAALGGAGPAAAETHRLALIAARNDGGEDREPLRYAGSDARTVAAVLEELGGVAASDQVVLQEASRRDLEEALREVRRRVDALRARGDRVELVFYYSGHADEQGLLLGAERLEYRALREALERMPAEVRIAIVDACASGTLTRDKGGRRRAPFLVDRASDVRGLAIITSSAASEASQESDRLGASFFTYYLVSALRGAGDADGDGLVTLGEAYAFTSQQTRARTERTEGGAQHPAYDMRLAGTGDLVLTDLRSTDATLVLAPELQGVVHVRASDGRPLVELRKEADRAVELGLPAGRYVVTVDRGGLSLDGSELTLARGARQVLERDALRRVEREPTTARGAATAVADYVEIPVELSLLPAFTTNGVAGDRAINFFSLSLLAGRSARLYGLGVGLLAHWVDEQVVGVQLSGGATLSSGAIDGVQLAGLSAIAWAPSTAAQLSLLCNLLGDDLRGGQLSAGANLVLGELSGAQLLSLFNMVAGQLVGAQLGLGFNFVGGDAIGLQLAPGGNLIRGDLTGAQLASAGVNVATGVRGLQLSAVNISERLHGVQLGVVNIAGEATGAQIGLVNIARSLQGAPVGLVNVILDGAVHPELVLDDSELVQVAVKHGGRVGYSMLLAGLQPFAAQPRWSLGAGVGARIPVGESLFVDVDLAGLSLHRGAWTYRELDLHSRLRASVGYSLLEHLSVVGGLSLNALVDTAREPALISTVPAWVIVERWPLVALWPGVQLGVQF